MLILKENELDLVSGGHPTLELEGATFVSSINAEKDGVRGHYDIYRTSDGCTFRVWNPGTVINTTTGAPEPA